jgi:hypothetical protein
MFATKQDYEQVLQSSTLRVVFRKKDNSERVMNCTLRPDIIESHGLTPKGSGVVVTDHQVRCVDVDVMEWRSFNINTVLVVSGY